MNAIDALFQSLKASGRRAFVPFLAAGDPDLALTAELLPALAESGADLVELGLPFSDPVADGPVIQAAYTRALGGGFKLADLFATVKTLTGGPTFRTPVVAMGSYSLVAKRGPERFVRECLEAGIAGAVLPDLPIEEAGELGRVCRDLGFALTLLVTPTTRPERAAKIVAACTGFVYVVSVVGITGAQTGGPEAVHQLLARLRTQTDRPLCVGFGVSRPEHVRDLREVADGVIVGTALVRLLEQAGTPAGRAKAVADVRRLCGELSAALRG